MSPSNGFLYSQSQVWEYFVSISASDLPSYWKLRENYNNICHLRPRSNGRRKWIVFSHTAKGKVRSRSTVGFLHLFPGVKVRALVIWFPLNRLQDSSGTSTNSRFNTLNYDFPTFSYVSCLVAVPPWQCCRRQNKQKPKRTPQLLHWERQREEFSRNKWASYVYSMDFKSQRRASPHCKALLNRF